MNSGRCFAVNKLMNSHQLILKITRAGFPALAALASFPALADTPANPRNLALANARFAFDLLKQIAADQPGRNVFISPYSVSSVLQMVSDGAAGKTKREMEGVLHLTGLASLDAACRDLAQTVTNGQKDVTLNLASSLWYKQGSSLKPAFAAACAHFFQAKTGALDFANPQSARTINDWAAQNTHGRIQNIIQWPINPLTRVILANAIYFKGQWARAFDPSATTNHPFNLPDGTQNSAPMMQQRGHFDYYRAPEYQAVRLPYAGGRLAMYLFLPGAGSNVRQMLVGFDGNAWRAQILPRFRDREGLVMLPRFKLSYAATLNQPLQALGMKRAFSTDADFSAMSDDKLLLSEVKQKSFVEVNEQGTEEAAATTATMRALAVMRPEAPFEMILDHPFFFMIGDETTHSILFMGIVANPVADGAP
jgi:serine protease inhibitor